MIEFAAAAVETIVALPETLPKGGDEVLKAGSTKMSGELNVLLENASEQIGELDWLNNLPEEIGEQISEKTSTFMVDDFGNVYVDNEKLLSNSTYVLNGNTYRTDDAGRIISCESTPQQMPENTRDNEAQTSSGGKDRRIGDQGGHIIGRDMGGDSGSGNLVAMDSRINQSDYKRMENDIKKALDNGKSLTTKTELEYSGSSERPDKITVTVTSDGKNTVYTFDNNLDNSLLDKLKDTCSKSDIEAIENVLDETGGTISSTKEEFDSEGKLERTTATVTYTGDDGKNYRRQVVINHNGGV